MWGIGVTVALAVCGLTFIAVVWDSWYWCVPATNRRGRQVCTPPDPPLIHQALELFLARFNALDWLTHYSRLFEGKTWTFKVLFRPRVYCVVDPKCVDHILRVNFDNYGKGPVFHQRMSCLLGDGIFNVDGAKWLEQRKISSHLFKHKNFKESMLDTINRKSQLVCSLVEDAVTRTRTRTHTDTHTHTRTRTCVMKSEGESGAVMDFSRLFLRYTLDSIGEIALGKDLGSLRGESENFVDAFDFIQRYLNDLVLRLPGVSLYTRYFTEDGRKYARALKTMDHYVLGLVKEAMCAPASSLSERGDLLSLFLTRTDHQGNPFSARYLRDVIVNTTIAGRDTTAYALGWTFVLLATHPEVQAKARAEAQTALGSTSTKDGQCFMTYDQSTTSCTLTRSSQRCCGCTRLCPRTPSTRSTTTHFPTAHTFPGAPMSCTPPMSWAACRICGKILDGSIPRGI